MHRLTKPCAIPAVALAAILACGCPLAAAAAGTPGQRCEAAQNDAAGKYAACIAKAEKSKVLTGDLVKYGLALSKCEGKLVSRWGKAEATATSTGATCPSSADRPSIQDFTDACGTSIAAAVAGGTLAVDPVACEDEVVTCGDDLAQCSSDLATCEGDLASEQAALAACEDDIATCESIQMEPISATAQYECFDDGGSAIPCAGSGQDGDYQAGHPQVFVDNGDGTITDKVSGLMWEKLSDDASIHDYNSATYTLANAYAKVASLNSAVFAGHSDWRLPNVRELDSITDIGRIAPAVDPIFHSNCVAGCTVLTCSCTRRHIYHASTTYRLAAANSYRINFEDGDVYAGSKSDAYYVRAVRNAD